MEREIVDALVESLNDPSAGWEYNEYKAFNNRIKCEIWLANGVDCVNVNFWGGNVAPGKSSWEAKVEYGGLNMLGLLVPWRHRVYRAAKKQQAAYLRHTKIRPSTIVAAIHSASRAAA